MSLIINTLLNFDSYLKKITSKFKNTNIIPDSATTAANADNVYLNQKVSATATEAAASVKKYIQKKNIKTITFYFHVLNKGTINKLTD
jgi:deoxyribodipyrimidine photolyase